jgi:hypothetical protein
MVYDAIEDLRRVRRKAIARSGALEMPARYCFHSPSPCAQGHGFLD